MKNNLFAFVIISLTLTFTMPANAYDDSEHEDRMQMLYKCIKDSIELTKVADQLTRDAKSYEDDTSSLDLELTLVNNAARMYRNSSQYDRYYFQNNYHNLLSDYNNHLNRHNALSKEIKADMRNAERMESRYNDVCPNVKATDDEWDKACANHKDVEFCMEE